MGPWSNNWLGNLIDGAFRQQRLPAWQPVLTPRTALPTFFVIGIIFTPIGGLLYWSNSRVRISACHSNLFSRLTLTTPVVDYRNQDRLHTLHTLWTTSLPGTASIHVVDFKRYQQSSSGSTCLSLWKLNKLRWSFLEESKWSKYPPMHHWFHSTRANARTRLFVLSLDRLLSESQTIHQQLRLRTTAWQPRFSKWKLWFLENDRYWFGYIPLWINRQFNVQW